MGDAWLDADQETIGLRTSPDRWLDVAQFRAHLAAYTAAPTAGRDALGAAVMLYRDDFLNGFTLPDCPDFDDWQFFQGEELRQQFAAALARLIDLLIAEEDHDVALPYARRWLALDPLHEPTHQALMRLYAATGQQAAALRQYELCVKSLDEELGVPPAAETTALYEQIRMGQRGQGSAASSLVTASSNDHPALPLPATPSSPPNVRYDWREAPTIEQFYGRERERQQLTAWLVDERCRLVSILGIGGLGKTTLAVQVVRDLATGDEQPFTRILWRSLLNAPPLAELLPDILHFLGLPQSVVLSESLDKRLSLLLDFLSQERCLLVFDNLESLIEAGERGGRYRSGYADYGQLLQYLGQHTHQSCLLLTSREQPQEMVRLERASTTVRSLSLTGLSLQAGQELVHRQGLRGEAEQETALIRRYSGHPLALMLVAETIAELYVGDIAAFLAEETLIFDDIRDVLDQHFARLSPLEQEIMTWLAIEREPITAPALAENLLGPVNHRDYLEALRSLQRRLLLQSFADGVGLQNVVTEYTTDRFIDELCRELITDRLTTFNHYPLLKAHTKDYVRESQQRLILKPITAQLIAQLGRNALLRKLRGYPDRLRLEQRRGYAGGNLLNWLLVLEEQLRNLDLSGLTLWQVYLRGKILHDLDLRGAEFKAARFTDTFGRLLCLTFSPDGTILAAGTAAGQIHFWRTVDWQPLQSWKVADDHVNSIAFSPDGRTFASTSGSWGGAIQLWDVTRLAEVNHPQPLQTLKGHTSITFSIAFSPDGRTLASGNRDETIRLWDLATGQTIRILEGHQLEINCVCFSPDGHTLASCGYGRQTIHLWDVTSGQTYHILEGHTDLIQKVYFSPDGQILASGSWDQTVRFWDVSSGQVVKILRGHTGKVTSVCFSPDGRILASGSSDQTIRLWDPVSGQTIQTCRGHTDWTGLVCFSPNGQTLASGSLDHSIRLWDISAASTLSEADRLNTSVTRPTEVVSGHTLHTFQGYRREIRSVCFSPDGQILASCGTGGVVSIWDSKGDAAEPLRLLQGHQAVVFALSFSRDSQTLASGDGMGVIHLWDLSQPADTPIQTFQGAPGVFSVCFSPDGRALAVGTGDRTICFWDVTTGQLIHTLTGHHDYVTSVRFSPDGQMLASSNADPTILLWDVMTGQILRSFQVHSGRVNRVAFSPDGQTLASVGDEGLIYLWDVQGTSSQPQQTLAGHRGKIDAVEFSPDGRMLASGGVDQQIRLWDVASGQTIRTLAGHTERVRAVYFSPDGQTLASGSDDGAVKFWDVRSGECLSTRRPDRPYERTKISCATGLTPAQISALKELGAVDEGS